MSRLLNSGFMRLKKSMTLYVLIICFAAMAIYLPTGAYFEEKKYTDIVYTPDAFFFTYASFIGIMAAVFCSLFIGTEYSDGTIRNKLVIGHTRTSVYLSNLIVSIAAGFILCISYMAIYCCISIPLFGAFSTDAKTLALQILCIFLITAVFASLFTMLAISVQNKALAAVIAVICAFLLLFATAYIYSMLSQPEFFEDYVINASGEVTKGEPVRNEFYLRGAKRAFYEFLMEFLPSGQVFLLMEGAISLTRTLFYDGIIFLASTGAGLLVFLKKDIK